MTFMMANGITKTNEKADLLIDEVMGEPAPVLSIVALIKGTLFFLWMP